MNYEIVPELDKARLETLERCRIMIEEGLKRGRDALKEIAQALTVINDQELYKDAGCKTLYEYCDAHLSMDRFSAYRMMCSGETVLRLEEGGIDITRIPSLESQLVLLHKIPASQLVHAWRDALIAMERENITVTTSSIKRLVNHVTRTEPPTKPKDGVNPTLSLDDEKVYYSEQGELALERIGRIVGPHVRQALEEGTLELSERDLIRWSQDDDVTLKNLAHYIVDLHWSPGKARAYEEAMITGATTLNSLAILATARGGVYETEIAIDNCEWEFRIQEKVISSSGSGKSG